MPSSLKEQTGDVKPCAPPIGVLLFEEHYIKGVTKTIGPRPLALTKGRKPSVFSKEPLNARNQAQTNPALFFIF